MNVHKFPPIYGFILLHVITWTVLPAVFHPNMPLDMTELASWGHQWEWGYYKHPPLSSWLTEVALLISNNSITAYFLLSQLSIGLCFFLIWKLGKHFLDEKSSLMAAVLLEGVYYYNFTSPEFNPNVLIIPLWPAVILSMWYALQTSKIRYWVLLGVCSALAMLAKYYSAALLVSLFLMLVVIKDFRYCWRTIGPYIAFIVFICMLMPHILWVYENNFLTFHYISHRSGAEYHPLNHLLFPLKFFGVQVLANLAALMAFFVALSLGYSSISLRNLCASSVQWSAKTAFLFFSGIMPFLLTIMVSLLFAVKLHSMWGTPLWSVTGIILFYVFAPRPLSKKFIKVLSSAIVVIAMLTVMSYTISYNFKHHKRAHFSGKLATEKILQVWRNFLPHTPLQIVVGDLWLAGNIAFYANGRPDVFIDNDTGKSPWLTDSILQEKGGVIVWDTITSGNNIPEYLLPSTGEIVMQDPISLKWQNHFNRPDYLLGWAIILPKHHNR